MLGVGHVVSGYLLWLCGHGVLLVTPIVSNISCCFGDDKNPALPKGPETMEILVYSLLWVMQDLYHQPYE